ncbi:MAG: putative transporter ATP-binding protein [Thermoleophilia bacterium]|nr:putative transporter ATP-binding protein [Thermoleophilia bacterium]
MDDTTPAIKARGLVKHYGETRAVDGVDLDIPRGIVFGLLGPNGAGKTTIIRMLATLVTPDSGSAEVLGHDLRDGDAVRSVVSLTGQFASVDEDLTGSENLILLCRLRGFARARARERSAQLLAAFGLEEAAARQVKTYSGGMRRRIDIAASIVVTPEVLFLDEPTTGLDPRSRNQVWSIIRALVAAGTTVLLTTQYLDEADQLADQIAVIEHGKVIALGTSGELKASVGSGSLTVRLVNAEDRPAALELLARELDIDVETSTDPVALVARGVQPDAAAAALGELARVGIATSDFAHGQPSLDEVFLALTGRPTSSSDDHSHAEVPA